MCLRILDFVKFKIHNYLKNNSMENFPNYIDCIEQCKPAKQGR